MGNARVQFGDVVLLHSNLVYNRLITLLEEHGSYISLCHQSAGMSGTTRWRRCEASI